MINRNFDNFAHLSVNRAPFLAISLVNGQINVLNLDKTILGNRSTVVERGSVKKDIGGSVRCK